MSEILDRLRDLYAETPNRPSRRALAAEVNVSHTSVSDALSGARVPSWPMLESIVAALGGDVEEFHQLYMDDLMSRERRAPSSLRLLDEILVELRAIRALLEDSRG